jgi:hypothetical protein
VGVLLVHVPAHRSGNGNIMGTPRGRLPPFAMRDLLRCCEFPRSGLRTVPRLGCDAEYRNLRQAATMIVDLAM